MAKAERVRDAAANFRIACHFVQQTIVEPPNARLRQATNGATRLG
jgi:hypothetical protein